MAIPLFMRRLKKKTFDFLIDTQMKQINNHSLHEEHEKIKFVKVPAFDHTILLSKCNNELFK